MLKPETQDEFDNYVATDEGATYMDSELFAERLFELFERINAGDQMTAADAAKFVDLPWPVFRHFFAHCLALLQRAWVTTDPTSRSVQ